MSSLLSLPPEILTQVAEKLVPRDNRSLRLACRYITGVVESLCLCTLWIDVGPGNRRRVLAKLKDFASGSLSNIEYAQELTIYNSETATQAEFAPTADEPFSVVLFNALMALKRVPKLTWWPDKSDDAFVQSAILDFMCRRRVAHLTINFYCGCHPSLPFRILCLENLESLSFRNLCRLHEEGASFMTLSLSRIICNSPNMTSLSIDTGYRNATTEAPSLHRFLSAEIERPPMPIKHLSLRTVRALLDEDTLYHLRSLESLSVHFNLTTPLHGSHLNEMWDTLREESIHLSAIDLNLVEVDDALLDYLVSYRGIRKLVFDNSYKLWGSPEIGPIAVRFFKDVLPKISSTLEVLHLEPSSVGAWCFGHDNAEAIAKCTNLRELTVSIVDMVQDHSQPIVELLHQTAAKLPHLHNLRKINVSTVPQIG
ncbi:hypothetical protein D9613_006546 [Agrocybe pediades]|uniref:F-box domain-containing protein n=1 Tax=Agrocybe pediades TaxID=84607 RepID=A0A8H4VK76_9AGAR|nr:hypothetical protein D9613_006546 [Agrocybe pediades]